VMAFSVISISSDSSEESVGTSTARVILFVTFPRDHHRRTRMRSLLLGGGADQFLLVDPIVLDHYLPIDLHQDTHQITLHRIISPQMAHREILCQILRQRLHQILIQTLHLILL
ncbi:hypothetical protein Tco_1350514, partial [Tanacetum coccineum]